MTDLSSQTDSGWAIGPEVCHHVDWNKHEWLLLLQEQHIVRPCLEKIKLQQTQALQPTAKPQARYEITTQTQFLCLICHFWKSFSKNSPNFLIWIHLVQLGSQNAEPLSDFFFYKPSGGWGGEKEGQRAAPLALINDTDSQVQSCI